MKRFALRLGALAAACALTACGSHANPGAPRAPQTAPRILQPNDVHGGPSMSSLDVLLGDAAPNLGGEKLRRLDLGILEIDAIENGQVTVLASYDQPRVVDVLAHVGDDGENVADSSVPRSDYQQLRLVVDLASSSAKFAYEKPQPVEFLTGVSSQSSAGAGVTTTTTSDGPGAVDIVVTQPFSIPQNRRQAVRVDFNAFESLALTGSGDLQAAPALFVAPLDDMGSITGRVVDASGNPISNATVVAVAQDGSIGNTDWTNGLGRFRIGTLRSGTYSLVVYNTYTTAAGRTVTASGGSSSQTVAGPTVSVQAHQTTRAGAISE